MTVVDLNTEKRIKAADAASDASLWTPRDALVDALRRLDAGDIAPETLAVVWTELVGDYGVRDRYIISTPGDDKMGFYKATHLAEAFKQSVWADGAA